MSPVSQSQRSTLLSASLLPADWLNPVRLLARGGGEEAKRGGRGRGREGSAVHRGSERTRTRTATQSGSLEVTTARTRPFCSTSGLHPRPERERSEGRTRGRGTDSRLDVSRCHIFHPEPESCRSRSGRLPSCLACAGRVGTEPLPGAPEQEPGEVVP